MPSYFCWGRVSTHMCDLLMCCLQTRQILHAQPYLLLSG